LTLGLKIVGSTAEIVIIDTGPGISPEGLEKIFEPLYTTKMQGTGLANKFSPSTTAAGRYTA